jgi:hypothetical protein
MILINILAVIFLGRTIIVGDAGLGLLILMYILAIANAFIAGLQVRNR